MNTQTAVSFDWVKNIEKVLLSLDEVPLLGEAPSVQWEALASYLSQCFEIEGFSITPSEMQWRTKDELLEGFSEPLWPLHITVSPLPEHITWLMSEADVYTLMGWFLTKGTQPLDQKNHDFCEGFYNFVALEVLQGLNETGSTTSISPKLAQGQELVQEEALCRDVNLSFQNQTVWGRLIIPPQLRQKWKEHFTPKKPSNLSSDIAKQLDVAVHLEIGNTTLGFEQWKQISVGDFVILDSCSAIPGDPKQRVTLTVNGQPIFRGRIKDDKLKLLEYPFIKEIEATMDENFPEEEETELEETLLENEEEEELPPPEEGPPETETAVPEETLVKPEEIPVNLIVEVGRIKINADTLMALQPGNMLDLKVTPEQGVDLVVNSKRVGRGELLKVGETLGIRILEMG